MLAPYPKGFFIGTWEDYRSGVPLAGPTYLSFICDGWSIKSRPGTSSLPHRSPKKPIMGVGRGEGGGRGEAGWPQGRKPLLFHQLSLRQKMHPTSGKAQKCEIEPWKRELRLKWVPTVWSSSASIHQLSHQRIKCPIKIGTGAWKEKGQLCLPLPAQAFQGLFSLSRKMRRSLAKLLNLPLGKE